MRWRVRYSGATTAGVTSDAAGDSGPRLDGAAGAGDSQAAPASTKSARTTSRIVTLVRPRAADGRFELVQRGPEVAHRAEMLERRLAVGPLGVEEVEEAGAPPTVRKLDGRTGLLRFRQVGIAQHDDPLALDRQRGQRGIDLGERLDSRRPRQRVRTLRLGARARDRLPRVAGVTLEREALDLQAKQLELGNVALLGPDPLKALDVVERPEVLLGEGERRPGDENTGEGALDLRDHQSPDVVQLV